MLSIAFSALICGTNKSY